MMSDEQERELAALIQEVRELQAWNNHRWWLTCREKFIKEGDVCSSYFFRRFQKRRARITVKKLKTKDGSWLEDPEQISKEMQEYYTDLYSAQEVSHEQNDHTRKLLQSLTPSVSPEHNALLDETLEENELKEALWIPPSGKSPGPDGMTVEVLKLVWPFVGRLFSSACAECWEEGSLHPLVKNGFIVLIPKGLQPETVAQWRPITLLNVIYKVLAKLVASRLALILPQHTPPEQQGFVKGRSTFNCILTFCMVHEALKQNRKSALFFSIDQEKAYDRLLPQFLWQVMSKMGFSDKFISVVKALQEDAESSLLFNGRVLPPFLIGKGVSSGVRQGCPLSPLLFVIATCPLIAAIKSENANRRIRPVDLGEGVAVSCMALADDFAFFTQIHKQDVHNLLTLLKQVEVASGARVNLSKSKILLIGWKRQFPAWANNLGFNLVSSKEVTNYLGAPLTTIGRGTAKGGALIIKAQTKAKYFSSPFLSFESRVLVAKHAIFPTLMYQLFTTAFNKSTLKKLQGIIREYIWAGDKEGKTSVPLTAWDNFTLPKDLGGLGLYDIPTFQQALVCKTLLTALVDPQSSLWAPILARIFFRMAAGGLQRPPQTTAPEMVFLLARSEYGIAEAKEMCCEMEWFCRERDILSWQNCRSWLTDEPQRFRLLPANIANIIQEPINCTWHESAQVCPLEEWITDDGIRLGTHWRMGMIYRVLERDRAAKQAQVMNDKWRLSWTPYQWSSIWGISEVKQLSNKHKCFLWRASLGAFMDGKQAKTFGLSDFVCSFCGTGVEDFTHAVWLCPRWGQLWREVANNFDWCLQLLDLRDGLALVPEVLFWAQQGPKYSRLFKLWLLAVVWRKLWSERCILRFQSKRNIVTVQMIAVYMLEEIWARRHKLGKKVIRHFASILLAVAPNVSNRYKDLLKEE
ncbi:hypothetical protein R1sor_005720 [Riccia sorocarpa]|uniref:Reverse transcriptase domain-containing protein n=1 Tax=Riccia sorocarpa TaxID=122646 RepID=A0ABD3HP27_9MARC